MRCTSSKIQNKTFFWAEYIQIYFLTLLIFNMNHLLLIYCLCILDKLLTKQNHRKNQQASDPIWKFEQCVAIWFCLLRYSLSTDIIRTWQSVWKKYSLSESSFKMSHTLDKRESFEDIPKKKLLKVRLSFWFMNYCIKTFSFL